MRRRRRLHVGRLLIVIIGIAALGAGAFFGGKAIYSMLNNDDNPEVVITGDQAESESSTTSANLNTDTNETSDYLGTVVIDPGHGGVDPGCSNGDIYEKDITLQIGLKLGAILEENNIKVVYTRQDDSNLTMDTYKIDAAGNTQTTDLRARAEFGEQYDADLFISLHVNSTADNSDSSGYTVYVHNGHSDSVDFGNIINEKLEALGYTTPLGVLDGSSYRVLRCNTTIAILVEMGFITGDLNYLTDDASQTALANALAEGIIQKLNNGMLEPDLVLEKQPDLY